MTFQKKSKMDFDKAIIVCSEMISMNNTFLIDEERPN